jgi:NAD(P)-dependent dehydrogenase (short-subunit alcohol dehydrogenase family)
MRSMNSTIQKLAAAFGVVFILVAIAGLIAPGGMAMQPTDPATAAKALGIFPVNLLHNVVHLAFGIWALAASRSWGGSKQFFVVGGYIYIVLTVLGFVSPAGFGLVPLGGADIGLHCLLGVVMLAIGYLLKPAAATTTA